MTIKPFSERVAVVTGAGQGIGFEICKQLALKGAQVVLNDIDKDLTAYAAAAINADYGICLGVPGDASDPAFIKNMIAAAVATYGHLDIAIANAGITLFGDFMSYTPETLYKVLHTNIGGSFFLAQESALQMKRQERGGSILFMSSVTGHQAHKDLAAYAMTKAAVEMLAKNLVLEISQYKINVNAIAPGATLTERTQLDPRYLATWSTITPMGRPATPEDIASAALFLVSNEARHITGQSLIIDGGWTSVSPLPF
jgi:glucose 1-dehydrogenase